MEWDPANFEDRVANLRRVWETREKLGLPHTEAEKVWSLLSLELEFSGQPMAELESIALQARQWIETKNPHYIDAAFLACRHAGIDPPPTLLGMMEDVATIRFAGLVGLGTGKRIRDESILADALRLICCLHLEGQISVQLAASKAARYLFDRGSEKIYKASTLEREYGKAFRKGNSPLENLMRAALQRASRKDRQEWARLARELPEADDELMGSRR
ncbi:hypothetical protein [Aurantiacibacter gilvus]|uniref:Uncharacterized protein n=1 Tax=Aurantiacibacter gilvus TaxID=3139141 RepID=A0ABU9IHM7_9SPHN